MRVLLIHNFYGSAAPSGENQAFEAERVLLVSRGHEVATFTRHSDEIRSGGVWGIIKAALATPWNPWTARLVRRAVEHFRPDVVHVHNTFPLISPAIFYAIGPRAARVLTLHNYRVLCAAGLFLREGKVCTKCADGRTVVPALVHGCYRASRLATAPVATSVALHQALGTWRHQVEAFIALSGFQRDRLVTAGLPARKVYLKPNFYPGNPAVIPWSGRGAHVVFVGRLSAEKGVLSLLRAWAAWGANAPELRLVGGGEVRAELERMGSGLPVRFLGQKSPTLAQAEIARARLLLLPSECFEGSPMVALEAFAFGTPVGVSNLGPLPAIVAAGRNGIVFEAGNPESLLREVSAAWQTPELLERLGQGARAEFETKYTEDANYSRVMQVYEAAIRERRRSARGSMA